MTPRQVFAHAEFEHFDRLDMLRANLAIAALGAQGSEDAIEKQMREWEA